MFLDSRVAIGIMTFSIMIIITIFGATIIVIIVVIISIIEIIEIVVIIITLSSS